MIKKISSNASRQKRHLRIRNNVVGTPERPRLNVFRSNTAIYVQVIDDQSQNTLTSANSKELKLGANIEAATAVGKAVAERALEKGVTVVAFDRSGFQYHGRVAALAESAREAGLKF